MDFLILKGKSLSAAVYWQLVIPASVEFHRASPGKFVYYSDYKVSDVRCSPRANEN